MKKNKPLPPAVPFDLHGWTVKEIKKDEAFRTEYLKGLITEKDVPVLMDNIHDLVTALGGVGKLARGTGLNRQALYKSLSGKVTPDFRTLLKIINYAGYDLSIAKMKRDKKEQRALAFAR